MRFRRLFAGALTGLVLFSSLPTALAFQPEPSLFTDLSTSHPNYMAIKYLRNKGIISGYPDSTFKPDKVVNRAEALKIILGASGIKVDSSEVFQQKLKEELSKVEVSDGFAFTDVELTDWFAPYVFEAYEKGIVRGYYDVQPCSLCKEGFIEVGYATFKPAQTVNLVENLKMLIKAKGIDVSDVSIPTDPAVLETFGIRSQNDWYAKYVVYAAEKNLIEGDSAEGYFHPEEGMTRGTLAEAVYRLLFMQERALDQYPDGMLLRDWGGEDITFDNSFNGEVFKSYFPYQTSAAGLKAAALECGTAHPDGYFDNLAKLLNGIEVIQYNFVQNKAAQDNSYVVQMIANEPDYPDLVTFRNDLDICAAGGPYPHDLNKDWLLFVGSCGGAGDNSGLPMGCSETQKIVEPSLKFQEGNHD